ncbi:MAG: DUF1638 domain-containing protein [Candidatus Marinimicrobia bacterium]|jgi:hypothetical protein|nr:DUF1638 domain-containing protein [Candidatus Neomarinimicrobiota bacterium]MDP7059241.1 DUF1638 domain-containing protein [Candidatus Neomarinimicrobiota bacterium]|tara:strand:+ start:11432 stop:12178 length:747 start_codon:yes stop_codon:yes gene_type:complete
MHLKIISCEVFQQELSNCLSKTTNEVEIEFISKGIHDLRQHEMKKRIVKSIRKNDDKGFDAILLGYGLCNTWVYGLKAEITPLVIPRSHDCIGILMGSHTKYENYFHNNPGTYFQSVGWMENSSNSNSIKKRSLKKLYGLDMTDKELITQFGKENLPYLKARLDQTRNYKKITFIDTQVEMSKKLSKAAQEKAESNGWAFEELEGNTRLLQRLVDGVWNKNEFLIIKPGEKVKQTYKEDLIESVKATP